MLLFWWYFLQEPPIVLHDQPSTIQIASPRPLSQPRPAKHQSIIYCHIAQKNKPNRQVIHDMNYTGLQTVEGGVFVGHVGHVKGNINTTLTDWCRPQGRKDTGLTRTLYTHSLNCEAQYEKSSIIQQYCLLDVSNITLHSYNCFRSDACIG